MCVKDRLAAYQFDAAVTYFGIVIENALHETVEISLGNSKKHVPRYTLSQIMEDGFKFGAESDDDGGLATMMGADGAVYDEVRE